MVEAETAQAEIEPRAGQIWKEVDPRFTRFVIVLSVLGSEIRVQRAQFIVEVGPLESHWQPNNDFPSRYAKKARFNGKRGGYALHQDVGQ